MEKNLDKAKGYIYNLLRVRPRSEKEIRIKLDSKGFDKSIFEKTITLFRENGLIDDDKFAQAWVESRLRTMPKGDIALRQELKEKGISKEIIEKVLFGKKESEEVVAGRLAEERIRRMAGLPKLKVKKRLYDYLMRRGFKYEIIEDVVRKMFVEYE